MKMMSMEQSRFIEEVKKRIAEKNYTYQYVAKEIGCTYNSLRNFFIGKNSTSNIIFGLCRVLDINIKIIDNDERNSN